VTEADWRSEGTDDLDWAGWALECARGCRRRRQSTIWSSARPTSRRPGRGLPGPGGAPDRSRLQTRAIGQWTGEHDETSSGQTRRPRLRRRRHTPTSRCPPGMAPTARRRRRRAYLWLRPDIGAATAADATAVIYGNVGFGLWAAVHRPRSERRRLDELASQARPKLSRPGRSSVRAAHDRTRAHSPDADFRHVDDAALAFGAT
jgi:hypothetical protein